MYDIPLRNKQQITNKKRTSNMNKTQFVKRAGIFTTLPERVVTGGAVPVCVEGCTAVSAAGGVGASEGAGA